MKTLNTIALCCVVLSALAIGQENQKGNGSWKFTKPELMKANGKVIKVEQPGYAAPCLADVTGDGKADLLVGQFNEGKIRVYPGGGEGGFEAGTWLQAEGGVAQVDGVW